ncbi:hypothetical protein BN1723_002734 [Verticillium longisporum]|uniref:HAM1-like N-terminal domain-containing protein n=1 Tax=Verticillium longisporum TaxID=100787 RepID=A0A0G4LHW2_VERLO|nr:hypothetical protein BN1723_002734 [Verticillium longisporum]
MAWLAAKTFVPVPRVYFFDSSANNDLGLEWVIMELIEGYTFANWIDDWADEDGIDQLTLTDDQMRLIGYQSNSYLLSLRARQFDKIGSLYCNWGTGEFYIGPMVHLDYFHGDRLQYEGLQRGPFSNISEYFKSLTDLTILEAHHMQEADRKQLLALTGAACWDVVGEGDPGFSKPPSVEGLQNRAHQINTELMPRLLAHVSNLPTFAGGVNNEAGPVDGWHTELMHPDLHSNNVLVTRSANGIPKIAAIIDWDWTLSEHITSPIMSANVNKPTDIKKKEADVNRKLQLYGIISAFQAGKVPSNDQIDVALNSFLNSKGIANPPEKLSPEGRALVADARNVVKNAQHLLLSKNQGNLLQDFIWQTEQTLGTLLITNGQFRKLLKDASVLLRDIAGDAATNAASQVRPSQEQLDDIDRPAEDNTWHDAPDFSKDNMRKQAQGLYKGDAKKDLKNVATAGNQAAHPTGSSDPNDLAQATARDQQQGTNSGVNAQAGVSNAKQTLQDKVDKNVNPETQEQIKKSKEEYRRKARDYLSKKVPENRRDQTIWRLKKMVLECQQHPDYSQAIETLLNLAEEYGSHSRAMAQGGSGTDSD